MLCRDMNKRLSLNQRVPGSSPGAPTTHSFEPGDFPRRGESHRVGGRASRSLTSLITTSIIRDLRTSAHLQFTDGTNRMPKSSRILLRPPALYTKLSLVWRPSCPPLRIRLAIRHADRRCHDRRFHLKWGGARLYDAVGDFGATSSRSSRHNRRQHTALGFDPARRAGDLTSAFVSLNRNKSSIALDLKTRRAGACTRLIAKPTW